ncbi:MAG: signal peptidase I [Oscillospiraceae bacterium]|nr:signal peptidase I [Oscillospiraceae bacterium]
MDDLLLDTAIAEEEKEEPVPEKKEKPKKTLKEEILDWAKTLVLYCFLPLAIFQTFCFMASVPTGSMETTIPVGAQVMTTRIFNKDNVERGDIIVFDSDELEIVLIKRCIGLPGDTVAFNGSGAVYINGEYLEEPYVSSWSGFEGEFTVPEDCYFFVGDNRAGSLDARFWENPYVHKSDIKGKARFVLFPFSSFGTLE